MAQRLVHYAIAKELIKVCDIKDSSRFILGSIIPDSHSKGEYTKTHYSVKKEDKKGYDFTGFLKDYKEEILSDDMYLGYYCHLIEDVLFRNFMYKAKGLYNKRHEENFREKLYSDYNNLNSILKERYNLVNITVEDIPEEFELTRLQDLEEEIKSDLSSIKVSEFNYITESIICEFIDYMVDILKNEIKSLRENSISILNSEEYYY